MQLIQIYGFSYRRIDFKTVWPRNGHSASLGVNEINILVILSKYRMVKSVSASTTCLSTI